MLIVKARQTEGMIGVVLLLFFLLIGPLALFFGADSRSWDERGWWPGAPRDARGGNDSVFCQIDRLPAHCYAEDAPTSKYRWEVDAMMRTPVTTVENHRPSAAPLR